MNATTTIDLCPHCGRPAHASESTEDGYHPACYAEVHGEPAIDGEGEPVQSFHGAQTDGGAA